MAVSLFPCGPHCLMVTYETRWACAHSSQLSALWSLSLSSPPLVVPNLLWTLSQDRTLILVEFLVNQESISYYRNPINSHRVKYMSFMTPLLQCFVSFFFFFISAFLGLFLTAPKWGVKFSPTPTSPQKRTSEFATFTPHLGNGTCFDLSWAHLLKKLLFPVV